MSDFNFLSWVRANPDSSAQELAADAIADYPVACIPLVAERIENIRRADELQRKQAAFSAFSDAYGGVALPKITEKLAKAKGMEKFSLPASLAGILDVEISLRDGSAFRLGDASISILEARRAMIVQQKNALQEEIARLDLVITILRKSGAACLRDLPQEGLPKGKTGSAKTMQATVGQGEAVAQM